MNYKVEEMETGKSKKNDIVLLVAAGSVEAGMQEGKNTEEKGVLRQICYRRKKRKAELKLTRLELM